MAIVSTVTSQQANQDLDFKSAGWRSILGGCLFYPLLNLTSLNMTSGPELYHTLLKFYFSLFPLLIPLAIVSVFFIIYVFKQFKRLLIERYDAHNLNAIFKALNIGYIVVGVIAVILGICVFAPIYNIPGVPHYFHLILIELFVGLLILSSFLVFGGIGIIFGVNLIRIPKESSRLLRVYSIISILASSCVITIILFPVGIVLHLANSVILGFLFFKAANTDIEVDFV